MNRHGFLDRATVTASALALRQDKFFSQSVTSPPIGDAVTDASPAFDGIDRDGIQEITIDTPAGTFTAAYRVWHWVGADAPTLIFHHGSGEDPFDQGRFSSNSFRRLVATDAWDAPVNVLVVRAPFHDRSSRDYARAMGDLSNFVGMCAAATALSNELTESVRDAGSPAVAICGISLGGWVTNLHRAYFGSADRYVPLFAGAALGEMFISSIYRKMVAPQARTSPEHLRKTLDFTEAFRENQADDCAPLLARYDQIIDLDTQQDAYTEMPLTVLDRGHITGSLATTRLRTHLLDALQELDTSP